MKIKEIVVGNRYDAKVSGRTVVLRVVQLHVRYNSLRGREQTVIECVNEFTGRSIMVQSPQRLRRYAGHAAPAWNPERRH